MPKFVEEGLDVLALHETRLAGRASREIADERRLRQLNPVDSVPDRKGGGVIERARARMEVEEEAADEPVPVPGLVRLDARIPHRRALDPLVRDPKDLRRNVEDALL